MAAFTQHNPILGFPSSSSTKSKVSAAIPAFNLSGFNIPSSSSVSRFSHSANLLGCKTLQTTFASNSDPLRSEKTIQGKASGTSSSNETEGTPPQGPPFLTIVAGALVFFFVCWVVGSLVIWAVSHIVNILTSK
ncbi:unnamed protein product [Rhodiola kirilowii]